MVLLNSEQLKKLTPARFRAYRKSVRGHLQIASYCDTCGEHYCKSNLERWPQLASIIKAYEDEIILIKKVSKGRNDSAKC